MDLVKHTLTASIFRSAGRCMPSAKALSRVCESLTKSVTTMNMPFQKQEDRKAGTTSPCRCFNWPAATREDRARVPLEAMFTSAQAFPPHCSFSGKQRQNKNAQTLFNAAMCD